MSEDTKKPTESDNGKVDKDASAESKTESGKVDKDVSAESKTESGKVDKDASAKAKSGQGKADKDVSAESESEGKTDRESDLEEGKMAFGGHIRELRDRLRNAVIALAIGFGISLRFAEDIFVILAKPIQDAWTKLSPENAALDTNISFYFHGLIDPFWAYFSIAFWSGIFIASPVIFYQLWKFISPGLYKNERRWGVLFAGTSAILFATGAVFCYFIVLPTVCEFLLGYSSNNLGSANVTLVPELTMRDYFDFAKRLLIGFGLIFELPLIILVLSIMGLVTHRTLWKFNRWAVLLSFVISAALTPPDIYSQMFMAGPLIVLYNISIILSFIVTKSKERKRKAMDED